MALIHCPECSREVSDSASACPNCGFDLTEYKTKPFTKVVNPLQSKMDSGYEYTSLRFIGGAAIIVVSIFTWNPLIIVGAMIGAIIIIVGFLAKLADERNYQYGRCPYCGTGLRVRVGDRTFKCPTCGNVGAQTEDTLESTHR